MSSGADLLKLTADIEAAQLQHADFKKLLQLLLLIVSETKSAADVPAFLDGYGFQTHQTLRILKLKRQAVRHLDIWAIHCELESRERQATPKNITTPKSN
jgi:hypothetical protein